RRRPAGPRLLRDHVRGVPLWPVRIPLAGPGLVLTVGGLSTPKRVRQIVRGREARRPGVDATGQPRRDLLEQPPVAVWITERGERAVAATVGIRTAGPTPPEQIGLVRARVHAIAVEHLAHLDAAATKLLAGGRDVGDDQVQALSGARRRRGDVLAEDDRAAGARRRELHDAEVVTAAELGVEPPPEPPVEFLRAIDVRDGDDDDLELH